MERYPIEIECPTWTWGIARLSWSEDRSTVQVRVPGRGWYHCAAEVYRRWRRAGPEACTQRVIDVHEGEVDSPPERFWREFDRRVLAVMCGEWEG